MNGSVTHFTGHVISWVEHEEVVLLKLLNKLQVSFNKIIIPLLGIGMTVWVVTMFVSVFIRYSECAKMISMVSGQKGF
jgi:hypothetical protein